MGSHERQRRGGGVEQTPPQYTARRKPEAVAVLSDIRMHEMLAFNDRLEDIQKAEDHGYHRHYRVLSELLAGGVIGAWITGAKFFPAFLVFVVAALFYLASLAIDEAHADSIGSFRRDFCRVTEDIELIENNVDAEDGAGARAAPGSGG